MIIGKGKQSHYTDTDVFLLPAGVASEQQLGGTALVHSHPPPVHWA